MRCRHWIEAALHHGGDTLTMDEVQARIRAGQYQFWPLPDSAIVTQVIPGAKGVEMNILLAGGELHTLELAMPTLESYAKARGATLITILGRLGWGRSFLTRTMGYKPVALLLGKQL